MKLETVKIKGGDGYIIINKSDFDPSKHKLFGVAEAKPEVKPEEKPRSKK